MLQFALGWYKIARVNADPICVGVANTNRTHKDTQFCLGYIPSLGHLGKQFLSSPACTEVKFSIRQQAVGAILRVLEIAAKCGVWTPLKNCRGKDVKLMLMPRLLAMNLDKKEAQHFFGMKNRYSCSKCKRRDGYSAFRLATRQNGPCIEALYNMSRGSQPEPVRKKASAKLGRWGFNPAA